MSNITNSNVSQAIKSHKFDVASVLDSQWLQVKNTKGVNFVGKKTLSYNYLAFKVGKWDQKLGKKAEDTYYNSIKKVRKIVGGTKYEKRR